MFKTSPVVILCIGGSDSCAGAGIQADLKTATALGAYGCTALTAVTAQNFGAITHIELLAASVLESQLEALASQLEFDAIKVGMLGSLDNAHLVAAFIRSVKTRFSHVSIVIDPVFGATSGATFADRPLIDFYQESLLALATVVTPNIGELALLLNQPCAENAGIAQAQARQLLSFGSQYVLIKGGHLKGERALDQLVSAEGCYELDGPRIDSDHTHGGGCTLATALAVFLAKKEPVRQACSHSKQFLTGAIEGGRSLNLVEQNGPLNHFLI